MSARGLALVSGAPVAQLCRRRTFRREHPGSEFPDAPVGGRLLAWVPDGPGDARFSGVQFSGESLEKLLDQAEKFFGDDEPDSG